MVKKIYLLMTFILFISCGMIHVHKFSMHDRQVKQYKNWEIKINLDAISIPKYTPKKQKKEFDYLPTISMNYSGPDKYPYFENDIMIDTLKIYYDDKSCMTSKREEGGTILDDYNDINKKKNIFINVDYHEAIYKFTYWNSQKDTIYVSLPPYEYTNNDIKIIKLYKKSDIDNIIEVPKTRFIKYIRFNSVLIPPKVKMIKVSFNLQTVDHFRSMVLNQGRIELNLYREDSRSWYIGD